MNTLITTIAALAAAVTIILFVACDEIKAVTPPVEADSTLGKLQVNNNSSQPNCVNYTG
jgi:hypothetical protein